ncbi:Uncharacterised protein [uncultured Clostridium sp.]|mgnify:FL=1|uniref:permease prefix domain 1-containing protein n=1 Tax=Waltera sp. TaxID=2815806 RepID=UPI000820D951|nr:Uncharacterised protein [uncultured Clostridium sp.]
MEEYLDSICNNIKCVTFRKTIRRELQTHMEEAFETELSNGLNQIDAELKVISEMGDPDVIGKQLNQEIPVHPPLLLPFSVLCIFVISVVAKLDMGSKMSLVEIVLPFGIMGCGFLIINLMKKIDIEKYSFLYKYVYILLLFIALLALLFSDNIFSREYLLQISPFCSILFTYCVYRFYQYNEWGRLGIALIFCVPIPLFWVSGAYAALILYGSSSLYSILMFTKRQGVRLFIGACILLSVLAFASLDLISRKINQGRFFFLKTGQFQKEYLEHHCDTYLLAACNNRYGFQCVLIYVILISLVMAEIIFMRKKIYNFYGRHIISCILIILTIYSAFSILLNIGYPILTSYALPFTDAKQVSTYILIIMVEMVSFYGNAVYCDYSFHKENKLMDDDGEKTIIYIKKWRRTQ